ncbi:MAG: DUF802 domain-containing protein [Zhongshania sp.]|uniref:DUF802 domain-containing protein n=1 Tax=Zhongshania sp. TaxID=1971902 RepID=UPI00260C54AF|nr:DUF802 domain-containing protein [Zhongshania sp.]MDF1692443.1 DUF802 domain-containing protein [Zhongshania sp.]
MTRILSVVAFVIGAVVVLWMALAFVGSNWLALGVSVLIALAFTAGFAELIRYQQASLGLSAALPKNADVVDDLEAWLAGVPQGLRNAVGQRIQSEYVGLPAPVLSPYLIGLLVMLGLLGTFIGMVTTLQGAVTALEGSTELEAVRAGLAAPIKGLGMAFATSVAGVTASAMLGFISTLSRRQRLQVSRQLDGQLRGAFKNFSLSYQREQSYKAMQQQAAALPDVAQQLATLADRLAQMSDDLGGKLISGQERFHVAAQAQYRELANSVDASLKSSLADSGRLVGESVGPVVQGFAQDVSQALQSSQQQISVAVQEHLAALSTRFANTTEEFSQGWQQGMQAQQRGSETLLAQVDDGLKAFNSEFAAASHSLLDTFSRVSDDSLARQDAAELARLANWSAVFERSASLLSDSAAQLTANAHAGSQEIAAEFQQLLHSSEQLVQARISSEEKWLSDYQQRMAELASTVQTELSSLREIEERRGEAAVERLAELQGAVGEHLATLANALEEPMGRLIASASETPRIAAELMAKLRAEMTENIARDNSLLGERRELMTQLNSLADSLQQSAAGQREAVESILQNSAGLLESIGSQFSDKVSDESTKLADIVSHFEVSSAELASMGEAFTSAVSLFSESNASLIKTMASIETALGNSTARSDEQMAYYVAQAREIIDHNMLSQQDIISQLQQLSGRAVAQAEARG